MQIIQHRWRYRPMATNPAELVAAMVPITKRFEQMVSWMYLDTKGLVTCAVGQMLPDLDSALALRWYKHDFSRDATMQEIAAEYARVKAMSPAKQAPYYS